jgi:cytochrome c peroxidase
VYRQGGFLFYDMSRKSILILFISACVLSMAWQTPPGPTQPSELARGYLRVELKTIVEGLDLSLKNRDDKQQLLSLYHKNREHYKHIEFFVEHCSPKEAKFYINGALVPKYMEEGSPNILYPQGFQKIEELLYDKKCDTKKVELTNELELLRSRFTDLQTYYESIEIRDELLLEMCQFQLFRIVAMNLNGSDATFSKTNTQESSWSLDGLKKVIESFSSYASKDKAVKAKQMQVMNAILLAQSYLQKNKDYDKLDRLTFATDYINKINKALVEFHTLCKLPWTSNKQALDLRKPLFLGESLHPGYFSIYYDDTLNTAEQAVLGKILFYDPILSSNNKRACSSCHAPSKAFTDGREKSLAFEPENNLPRNAPTLLNVVYQKAFFYDGRAYQLEQQVFDVVHNQVEMGSNLDAVVLKLRKSREYKDLFKKAFPSSDDSSITVYGIQKAITGYEKTLISFNSRFDRYLKGNKKALTAQEKNGYTVFAGKALCGSCHFFPLFNGTVPPYYNDSEFEVIGTPATKANKELDADIGRYVVTKAKEHNNAFKTPTVRNIQLTAPYMHNGVYTTIEEVVEFYHKGGGAGFKYDVPNQTLPFDSLQLNASEKKDLVAFLKSLTDTSSIHTAKFPLPQFENEPKWNQRKFGGEY